jgi:hypothetical protein
MSFGAVVALVAVYETWGARLAYLFHSGSFARKVLGYLGAIAVTTLIATVGTEPFAIYHFHHRRTRPVRRSASTGAAGRSGSRRRSRHS